MPNQSLGIPQLGIPQKAIRRSATHRANMFSASEAAKVETGKRQMRDEFLQALQFRHACKLFDENRALPRPDLDYILEAGRLLPHRSASSRGDFSSSKTRHSAGVCAPPVGTSRRSRLRAPSSSSSLSSPN